eukprot:430790_1
MSHGSRPQPNFIQWLTNVVKLAQYKSNLTSNGYDTIEFVQHIENKQQLSEIGIKKRGHQLQLLKAIQNLRSTQPTITSYSSPSNLFEHQSVEFTEPISNTHTLFPPPLANTNHLTPIPIFPTQLCANISASNISPTTTPFDTSTSSSYSPTNPNVNNHSHLIGNPSNYGIQSNHISNHNIHSHMNEYINVDNINCIAPTNGNNISNSNTFSITNEPTIYTSKSNTPRIHNIINAGYNTIQPHYNINQSSNMNGHINMNNINRIAVTNGNNITDSTMPTIQNEPTINVAFNVNSESAAAVALPPRVDANGNDKAEMDDDIQEDDNMERAYTHQYHQHIIHQNILQNISKHIPINITNI